MTKELTADQKKVIVEMITKIANHIKGNQFFKENVIDFKKDYTFKEIGFDDLDFVELIMECEKLWNVSLPDDKFYKVKTLNDFFKILEESLY